ncbi:hypothetical protein GCM10027318_25450 [Massilia agilis]
MTVALLLYVASLASPSFQCGRADSFYGWYVLLIGWFGLLALSPWWFVNIPFFFMIGALALNSVGKNRFLPGLTALAALATAFVHHPGCLVGGGAPGESSGLGIGGYLWVASIVIASIAYIAHRPASANQRCFSAIIAGPVAPQDLQRRLRLVRWGGLIAALAIYALSLALPAFTCATARSATGLEVLTTGWAGALLAVGHEYRWYLNLALFVVLWHLAFDNVRLSPLVPIMTALISLAALVPGAPGCQSPGTPDPSLGLAAGGYLWVASFFVASLTYLIYQKMSAALPKES